MYQSLRFVPISWPWKRETREPIALRQDGDATQNTATLLEAIAAALPDPCLLLSPDGRVSLANAQAQEVLDFDPSGQHLSAAIRSPVILDALNNVLRNGQPVRADYELRGRIPRHFEAFVAPVKEGQTIAAILILLRDLTREQQVERLRADFVANASHELRTPLASLSGFIETLQGAAKNDEKARARFLELMRTQAERMKRLIDDLLSLSRIELSEHVAPSETVHLTQVARHMAEVMMPLARENGMTIRLDTYENIAVAGDWDELVQVAENLIENAIKYASSGKILTVSTRLTDGHAELSVSDEGPGIAAEHIPRLTERFYRVSVQDSRSRGGTGLGLAIVKHIVNRHRGRLVIHSEPGLGATFTVRLPAIPYIQKK